MIQYLKRFITLMVGLSIFIGVPYLFGGWWLFGSWFPALFAMVYLDE